MNWKNYDEVDDLEEGECVVVCDIHSKLVTVGKLVLEEDENFESWLVWHVVDTEHIAKLPCDYYVTHWMKFPELPKEEE